MDIQKILHIIETGAQVTPDFLRLAGEVVKATRGTDQNALKAALSAARDRSDSLHQQVQQ